MGSLVPGWDADIGVPRGLAPDDTSIDKEPEPEGYFARLRSHRHTHGGDDNANFGSSLARVSAPMSYERSATLQPKQVHPSFASSSMGHGGSPASSHGTKHLAGSPGSGYGAKQPHKYQFTDWSEELTSLRPGSLGRVSTGTGGSAREREEGEHERHSAAWWRALEVGHLNEHPDQAQNSVHGTDRSTYVPQFTQSQKLDFGEKGDADK